jgi:hypothetical protein
VGHLGAVVDGLLYVANFAEQLTFEGLGDQNVPRSGQASADSKGLGRRIDVVELKILCRSAARAATAEHVDELGTTAVPPGFVVAPQVLGTSLAGLTHWLAARLDL